MSQSTGYDLPEMNQGGWGPGRLAIASQVEIWLWLNELYFMDVYGKYNLIFIVNGGGYKQIYNISNNIL